MARTLAVVGPTATGKTALGLVLAPSLDGEFISDDGHYVSENCWIHSWSAGNLREILDPTSDVSEVMDGVEEEKQDT